MKEINRSDGMMNAPPKNKSCTRRVHEKSGKSWRLRHPKSIADVMPFHPQHLHPARGSWRRRSWPTCAPRSMLQEDQRSVDPKAL